MNFFNMSITDVPALEMAASKKSRNIIFSRMTLGISKLYGTVFHR